MKPSTNSHHGLYTAAQTRALDREFITTHGVPGIALMQRAGRAVFNLIDEHWPGASPLHVFCGTGNNGGDGFIVARLARDRGIEVQVHLVGEPSSIKGDARTALEAAQSAGVVIAPFDPGASLHTGVIVDALLGTGLRDEVRAPFAQAIAAINASGRPVVAVDIPSGLCSDTGSVRGAAVQANITVTFIARKRGLFTGQARDHCGSVVFDDLAAPASIYASLPHAAELLDIRSLQTVLRQRPRSAHKGHCGHVLVIGGNHGMGGAALMAAETAARCGAGLVSVATRPEHVAGMIARRPELMARGIVNARDVESLLAAASVLVIGPGLGRDAWAEQLLYRALSAGKPAILDADALQLLAGMPPEAIADSAQWIITPHPGEAAQLLGCPTADINADRFAALAALRARFAGAVVLKGAGTLVGTGAGPVGVCPYGNPGMASGGMGDVLSGVLAALLAQRVSLADAPRLGVCMHARAADLACGDGERGLLATDLLPWLRRQCNGLFDAS